MLFQKGVYPYEYKDDWEKFNETSLPEKEDFHSNLKLKILLMEIINKQKEFKIKRFSWIPWFIVQVDTLFPAD